MIWGLPVSLAGNQSERPETYRPMPNINWSRRRVGSARRGSVVTLAELVGIETLSILCLRSTNATNREVAEMSGSGGCRFVILL